MGGFAPEAIPSPPPPVASDSEDEDDDDGDDLCTLSSLSHYNPITEPCARFLLSLLEHLTIDFPSHFILSLIDVFQDSASRESLSFLLLRSEERRVGKECSS